MKTVLYNKDNGSMSREYEGGYIVDGQPGWLPENMVELIITYMQQPTYNVETEYLEAKTEVDLENNMLIRGWEIKQYSAYEIAMRSWHRPEYSKRIIAPAQLINDYPEIGLHMLVNKLPIEPSDDGESVFLYMNIIRPEHQSLVDSLNGIIVVEDRPLPTI